MKKELTLKTNARDFHLEKAEKAEAEMLRCLGVPVLNRLRFRQTVEAGIAFNGGKIATVSAQGG